MTQSFAFDPHASQQANEQLVRSLADVATQAEAEVVEEDKQKEDLRPRVNLRQSARRRARTEGGKFVADNPETPQNEAWEEENSAGKLG
jgi:hypothetical protein